jgi:hypothetical protein
MGAVRSADQSLTAVITADAVHALNCGGGRRDRNHQVDRGDDCDRSASGCETEAQ